MRHRHRWMEWGKESDWETWDRKNERKSESETKGMRKREKRQREREWDRQRDRKRAEEKWYWMNETERDRWRGRQKERDNEKEKYTERRKGSQRVRLKERDRQMKRQTDRTNLTCVEIWKDWNVFQVLKNTRFGSICFCNQCLNPHHEALKLIKSLFKLPHVPLQPPPPPPPPLHLHRAKNNEHSLTPFSLQIHLLTNQGCNYPRRVTGTLTHLSCVIALFLKKKKQCFESVLSDPSLWSRDQTRDHEKITPSNKLSAPCQIRPFLLTVCKALIGLGEGGGARD